MTNKTVKKIIPTELQEQIALITWAKLKKIPLVHHANEGLRTSRYGKILKLAGLAPGYPDLSLMQARGGYFGLFIELKRNRRYSESEMALKSWMMQDNWLAILNRDGYLAVRCFGCDEGMKLVDMYMKWPLTVPVFNT